MKEWIGFVCFLLAIVLICALESMCSKDGLRIEIDGQVHTVKIQ